MKFVYKQFVLTQLIDCKRIAIDVACICVFVITHDCIRSRSKTFSYQSKLYNNFLKSKSNIFISTYDLHMINAYYTYIF